MATRLERVIIDIDDRGTRPMATLAGKTRLAARELDKADRSVVSFNKSTTDVGRNIDKLSGRLGLLVDVAATLGPALVPIGTAAVPAVAGLANQLGFAAIAGGTAILAFQGVGDALKAVNEAQIEPTAANLEKAREAMAKLGPAGRDFVMTLQELRPQLQGLQDTAQAGLFPGLSEGIDVLMGRMPEVDGIIQQTSEALGELAEQGGEALAGPEWDDFFAMLETQAKPTLLEFGQTLGNFTRGLTELWMAFMPLSRDFSGGMLDMSRSFAQWAEGLSGSSGFAEFTDYIRETGPQVLDTLGSLVMALVDISRAAAPLGGPALQVIEAFANALSAIAKSDVGTPLLTAVAALRAYSLATTVAQKTQGAFTRQQTAFVGGMERQRGTLRSLRADWAAYGAVTRTAQGRAQASASQMIAHRAAAERLRGTLGSTALAAGKAGAGIGAMALLSTGAADGIGLTNTASLALAGTMLGPWGAAVGAASGSLLDAKAAAKEAGAAMRELNASVQAGDFSRVKSQIAAVNAQLKDLKNVSREGFLGLGDVWETIQQDVGFSLSGTTRQAEIARQQAAVRAAQAAAEEQRAANGREAVAQATVRAANLANAGFKLTAAGAREAAMSTDQFKRSLISANEALTRMGSVDAYKSSLLDMKDALAQNGRTLSQNTRAGLANRGALQAIATTALAAADNIGNFSQRTKLLQGARRNFIQAATAAGMTRDRAKALADELGLVGRIKARPTVEERGADASRKRVENMRAEIARLRGKTVTADERGAAAARQRIAYLRGEIARLSGKSVTITTNYVQRYTTLRATGRFVGGRAIAADGDTVPKTGKPYADRHPYLLADGEEVTSNRYGQADAFRPVLKAINANLPRAVIKGMLADGGTAGLASRTKDELYAMAKRRNIAGRSSMNKSQLIRALSKGSPAKKSTKSKPLTKPQQRRVKARRASINKQLDRWRDALDNSRAAIARETAIRDDLSEKREALSGSVRDQFRSDIFAQSNVWAAGGGAGGAIGVLQKDLAGIRTFYAQLGELSKRGLKGDALAAIAATGDIGKAGGFLAMDQATLSQYQTLYNDRQKYSQNLGDWAGNYAYASQMTAQNKLIAASTKAAKTQTAAIKRLEKAYKATPAQIGRQINSAAAKGKKKRR